MEDQEKEPKRKRYNILDTWDGEYHGNVFGDKVAIRGGIFLLLVLLLMIYRHVTMGVPFGGQPIEKTEQVQEPLQE